MFAPHEEVYCLEWDMWVVAEELISVCMLSQVFPPHEEVYCLEWDMWVRAEEMTSVCSHKYSPFYSLEWEHVSSGRRVDKFL